MKYFSILLLFFFLTSGSFAQPNLPDNGPVYTSEEIPKIHISIHPDSLEELYLEENWYSDHEYPAEFVFESDTQTDTIALIGFRFRGNTSRDKLKKSFKVSFNTFVNGQKYFGLEKLNLNAEVNDPAMMRSRLCWDLFRERKVPAPRSNHVEVYINEEYFGLYLNTEHIDEEFCELRFGSQGGNLYKCSYPADLGYLGSNPDNYKVALWDSRTYELKTNEELDDYSDLAEFIGFLNLSSDEELRCGLYRYFNVYAYLKVAAVDVLTGNWDGYIYNQNNFYLYHNPTTDQFEYIPYDTDNTWGIDWLDRNWSNRNIYNWSQTGADRPLFNRLMDIDYFRDIFSYHISDLLDNYYFTSVHQNYIQGLQNFIEASALADPYRPLDWDFDESDFLDALDEAAGGHVDYGVSEFAEIRKNAALQQLEDVSISPIPYYVNEDFESFPNTLKIEVGLEGPSCLSGIINYSIDGVQQLSQTISNPDSSLIAEISLPDNFEEISYNVSLTGEGGMSTTLFCSDRTVYNSNVLNLVINEVMTSNNSTIPDEAGEYDDWIELHNPTETIINLDGYYITDNSASSSKFRLPEHDMQPGEYVLIWADRDLHDGPFHANFRLNASGEEVLLFKSEPGGIRYIDGTDVPALPSDYSYGRETDAALPWVLFANPTPGASNSEFLSTASIGSESRLVYPNPVSDVLFFGIETDYQILTIDGRIIAGGSGEYFDVSDLDDGIYLIRCPIFVQTFIKK
jgi:hypothetical protein